MSEAEPIEGVAVVGMAGRFPGAPDLRIFWENLWRGVESITRFSDPAATVRLSGGGGNDYVYARGVLASPELFDAAFFGFTPREAELMDPQHRVLLELAWEALEDAGCDATRYPGAIGVFAGCSMNTYLLYNLCDRRDFIEQIIDAHQVAAHPALIGNDKDFLPTRIAYKMNLRGPAVNVQTACSTSLSATVLATNALLAYQCDMALAGGVSISFPQERGYRYLEGGMVSSDGRCRAFDAGAQGMLYGAGAGVVVLKRLADALADRDGIYAVIKGAAMNNDGSAKVSYMAPSVDGQAEVIALAQALAGVGADTIDYVEAHGTGTPLGDPIEVAALTKAFRATTDRSGYCALGSVKTNIGHLESAAGVAGLAKTVLALHHRKIPPSLNFERPNPKIDFEASPFFVNTNPREWPDHGRPRRAGVSSFGVGGTNAHVVLEEAPGSEPAEGRPGRPWQLLVLSARTESALDDQARRLAGFLRENPRISLPDVGHTLQTGRRMMKYRRALVCRDVTGAIAALEDPSAAGSSRGEAAPTSPRLAFLFPGQGAQHPQMGRELYEHEPVFREEIDRQAAQVAGDLGLDLRELLYPSPEREAWAAERLTETRYTQPALFAVEWAVARLLRAWGCAPESMLGHSVGEYVAASIAGVLAEGRALELVAARGRMVQQQPGGTMLAVRMPETELRQMLGDQLSLAAINAPSLSVASGPEEAIARLAAQLAGRGIEARRLHTSHAFHSAMLDAVVVPFRELVAREPLAEPRLPFVSNVTGDWITRDQATDPTYWASHLRQTVRFAAGVAKLLEQPGRVLVEVGPGQTLTALSRQQARGTLVLPTLPAARSDAGALRTLLEAAGRLWVAGVELDWAALHSGERRRRLHLPTYPFERKRYWVEPKRGAAAPSTVPTIVTGSPVAAPPTEVQSAMANAPAAPVPPPRVDRLESGVREALSELSGIPFAEIDPRATFLELGFDSLFLTQASQALERRFGVKITFRQLLDKVPSAGAVARLLDETLPLDAEPAAPAAPTPTAAAPTVTGPAAPAIPALPALAGAGAPGTLVERLLQEQLRIMTEQLQLVRSLGDSAGTVLHAPAAPIPAPALVVAAAATPMPAVVPSPPMPAAAPGAPAADSAASDPARAFLPSAKATGDLTPSQRRYLDAFMARYVERTRESKRLTQQHRGRHADPRTASGFNMLWKEMCYPLVVVRSRGSRLLDADGNEYIDLLNGFGPNFLGHSPDFLRQALHDQVEAGIEVGPQTPHAGPAAELFCELTGSERVSWVNTGSEAVQAAIRIARTVTGREKVVVFHKDYHGNFDEVLVKPSLLGGVRRTLPIAPGITAGSVANIVVLEYGALESLDYLRQHGSEIAAVLAEPVQSRRPELRPREFVHQLRRLTEECGALLVFDEVITGFRMGPGGAQAYYGVRADLATYGKVFAGGMPIGAVAGRREYMDTFDGGYWEYGDQSGPERPVTFFAGTFVRHPLAMAAVHATLRHLKEAGPAMWDALNARADRLGRTLDSFCLDSGAPFRVPNNCTQFFVRAADDARFAPLLFYHLREKGVYILEGFPSYLTLAHGDEEVDYVVRAFRESVHELQEAGFFAAARPVPARRQGLAGPPRLMTEPPPPPRPPVPVPVTAAQRELWLAAGMGDEANCSFNESSSLSFRGELNRPALEQALERLLARHDSLRARLSPDGETQTFQPPERVTLTPEDLSGLPEAEREATVRRAVEAESRTPFDLARGPLFRMRLLRLGSEDHLLLLTSHHIVCDGWSFSVLFHELADLFNQARGATGALESAMQFAEYAQLQQQARERGDNARAESYWLDVFASPPPDLELPADRPRPPLKTYAGAVQHHLIPAERLAALKQASAQRGQTLFATLFACANVLLHRLTGQDDLVLGVPAAGQTMVGRPELVGHCLNFLPIRTRLSADEPFEAFVARASRLVLDAYDHQDCTFGTLVSKLRLHRDPSRLPLVSAMFNIDKSDLDRLSFDGIDVRARKNPKHFVNFEIFLNLVQTREGLLVECEHNTDLFDTDTVRRWLQHFDTLVGSTVAGPATALGRLALLEAAEQRQIVTTWNETAAAYDETATVHALLEAQADRTPNRVAAVCGGTELTYAALDARANAVAERLASMGVGPDALVGVAVPRSLDMLAGVLGVLKAGGAYVPLDPSLPAERLRFMLEDAGVAVLLTGEDALAGMGTLSTPRLRIEDVPAAAASRPAHRSGARDLAYVIYTSGSTGRPKGVAIEHRSVVNFLRSMQKAPGLAPSDVLLAVTTLSFDIAGLELYLPLATGARVVIADRTTAADGFALLREIERHGVTVLQATPASWQMLLEAGLARPGLKALCGGEALTEELARRLLAAGVDLWNMYGPTETTIWSTCMQVPVDFAGRISIGRPIDNTTVYVVDPALQPVPLGVAGELLIGGHGVARGYLNRPELSAERFVADPFRPGELVYRTGDLARIRPDGSIECLGRRDHQVKIRGFRVELGEIEAALATHPRVRQCAVTTEELPGDHRRLVGYVVPRDTTPWSELSAELRSHLRDRLPDYMVPPVVVALGALPLSPSGKVDRKQLPPATAEEPAPEVASYTPAEATLLRIAGDVLGTPRVRPEDNLFDLGADSLLLFRISARAREAGLDLSPRQFFQHQTVAALARAAAPVAPASQEDAPISRLARESRRRTPQAPSASPEVPRR